MADASAKSTYRMRRLNRSFGVLYSALDSPRVARPVLVGTLVIHTILLGYSAYVHSPTYDEPGHLVAGLSHWKFGQFDLYRNNPPLVRMTAALPVMAAGCEEDWSGFYDKPGAMPVFGIGDDWIKANGERTFFLMMIARWACIPFSWIGAITCFLWARDLYGRPAGVLAAVFWCFEPNILAHASLITSDAAGAALGAAACYAFWRWLVRPSWQQAALAGLLLGLAELTKMTLSVFFMLWPVMWVAYRMSDWRTVSRRDWLREAGMIALQLAIGLHILNAGYGFEGTFQQLKDFQFVSERLSGNKPPDRQSASPNHVPGNRFAGAWLGEIPVPLPANYLLGIDLQQSQFEHWHKPAYLRGEWRDTGWWYYYLYAAAVKLPLALWLLGALALAGRFVGIAPSPAGGGLGWGSLRDEFVLLFPALIVFAFVSSQTEINEHFRYVLPCFPYAFIGISQLAGAFSENIRGRA